MMGILWESYKHCGLFLVNHCTNCDGESFIVGKKYDGNTNERKRSRDQAIPVSQ